MNTILDTNTPEFITFFQGCEKIYNDYMDRSFPVIPGHSIRSDYFHFKRGPRYIRLFRRANEQSDGTVHCFVDRTNGDVLKAASWKAPAKHARGNLFDKDNGLGSMGEYGPAYLR